MSFIRTVSVSVGVWTLVAISLERYFAICRPLKSRRWQTQFHAYKMIAVIRVPRMKVSSVFGGKLKGSDFSNESRVQVRSNGNNCVSRDTKDSSNEEQQDSGCPFNRQHIIRSNYMGKSIEAKKKTVSRNETASKYSISCLLFPGDKDAVRDRAGIFRLLGTVARDQYLVSFRARFRVFDRRQHGDQPDSFHMARIPVPTFYRVGCRNSDIAMASTRNAAQAGNNSELSGNESAVYLGKASLATRSGNSFTRV
ncbi:Cholecystokinin receptor type A [Apis cerana cerana]|uniref:Cholecystokinin receptor type A n=1 Tax=Apis cerana cerana TaxID=94128 RepID=A0A2A3EKH3_APICC|nr:Cholecystokinin receptor type A [Apis cerana cerana]